MATFRKFKHFGTNEPATKFEYIESVISFIASILKLPHYLWLNQVSQDFSLILDHCKVHRYSSTDFEMPTTPLL